MAKSLAEIRAQLQAEQDQKANRGAKSKSFEAVYPFWDAPDDSTTTVRFLPDRDESRMYFWRERMIISLPFRSVEGNPEITECMVEVPCVKMYDPKAKCPIQEDTKSLWNGSEDDKALARTYYFKRNFLYQGFVVNGAVQEEEPPENPIRRFIINPKLHDIIRASLNDPDIEESPVDFEHGLDFRIMKTKNGKYADYTTSSFARKTRPLSLSEIDAVEQHGCYDLSEFLPRRPSPEMMDVIMEMYQESRYGAGEYKLKWAEFYTPKGVRLEGVGSTRQSKDEETVQQAPAQVQQAQVQQAQVQQAPVQQAPVQQAPVQQAPVQQSAAPSASVDILANLRSRMQQNNPN